MIIQNFIDRDVELQELKKIVESKKHEFIIIYGRRRIGKTELILEATKDTNRLYYLAIGEKNLERFYELCVKQFPESARLKMDWEIIFDFLKTRVAVVVIDEFQNLIVEDKNILHTFQSIVDITLKSSALKLFLLGSSVSIMTSKVLAYKSPLYGRRTGSMELKAISFFEIKKFFPKSAIEEQVRIYGFADGVPFYLVKMEGEFWGWLENEVKREKGFLRDEVEFLMRYEFADTSTYKLILEAIANGKTKINEIKDFIKVKRTDISPYIRNLLDVRLIQREVPITENVKSRLGRYYLADNFLKFWFRYVYPRLSSIEEGVFDIKYVRNEYPTYLGGVFEDIAKEWLIKNQKRLFTFTKIGRWWFKDNEIDIVATNDGEKKILFAECKWQENVDARKIIQELQKKATLVQWSNNKRKETYILFAKTFKQKIKEENVLLFELKDMERV